MEQSKGKQQHFYKSYKLSNCQYNHRYEGNNYNAPSSHVYFKTSRIQKHSLKWRKDHYVGSHKSRNPYRKNDISSRKSGKSSEDAEEEERKKKLNDTAKKLLNKIKTWNAEKNISEESTQSKEDSQQSSDPNPVISELESWHSEEKISGDSKKRIAHSKKAKLMKNRTPKSLKQPVKPMAKYDVNRATVKDFQSRIQHKLIEEIMQMPKENLQNVLNDPKINPIMGLKMSRLVQENRPLITQKLRVLAESKMKSLGFASNPQLLVDIDKLIDPVIETDLSALPYELIKQMENLFQVQFDYSENSLEQSQVGVGVCDSTESNQLQETTSINSLEPSDRTQVSTPKEDLSIYECSTDEDEEISVKGLGVLKEEHNLDLPHCSQTSETEEAVEMIFDGQDEIKLPFEPADCGAELQTAEARESKEEIAEIVPKENQRAEEKKVSTTGTASPDASEGSTQIVSSTGLTSETCRSEDNTRAEVSTQTSEEVGVLYGVPLPKESKDNSTSSLLEEVSSIQKLTNKLNERRLTIFLELSRMNPDGNFVCDGRTRENFAETLSNGSVHLMEALKEFFKGRSQKAKNSGQSGWKSSRKWVNRNKSRNKDVR